ncbi:MAG: energy transducer TonB [Janthinobacterium lividum]
MRFATSCWLLATLTATTALAQTHPQKKDIHEDFTQDGEQSKPEPLNAKVYTYVEQMPLLNGQHAYLASSAAITHSVVVPANAPAGRVYVQFIVTKEGQVSHPHIVKGLRADLDSAVVAATRRLPRFTPGKQSNRVVAVVITVGVTFPVAQQP